MDERVKRRVFLISTLEIELPMAEQVGKRFSNVRYWRYVFTPILFITLAFGIFMLYSGDSASKSSFPTLTTILRRNTNTASLSSILGEMQKLST